MTRTNAKIRAGQVAGEDLLVERPELGVGCWTLVAAGDPFPADLAGREVRPRYTGDDTRPEPVIDPGSTPAASDGEGGV